MQFMAIGQFAARTGLSAKALRLYHELGLVVPARVDPSSGYRLYAENQVEQARLVGYLRRADMPLALIASALTMDGARGRPGGNAMVGTGRAQGRRAPGAGVLPPGTPPRSGPRHV